MTEKVLWLAGMIMVMILAGLYMWHELPPPSAEELRVRDREDARRECRLLIKNCQEKWGEDSKRACAEAAAPILAACAQNYEVWP